jgi:hypothetical protein
MISDSSVLVAQVHGMHTYNILNRTDPTCHHGALHTSAPVGDTLQNKY